jgi:predicted DNA-binding transcriptional regulator YafY
MDAADRNGDTLRKLNAFWNRNAANWLSVDFSDWGERDAWQFQALKRAILERRVVEFEYYGTNGMKTSRRVEPSQLCFKSKAWYLNGFCLAKNDGRLFKLTRIVGLSVTDERCAERGAGRRKEPGGGVGAGVGAGGGGVGDGVGAGGTFSDRQGGAGGTGVASAVNAGANYGSGEIVNSVTTFILKIDSRMAYRVYDDFDESEITRHEDGSFIATPTWYIDEWACSLLLSYGECLEVIEPPCARAAMRDKLSAMREYYDKDYAESLT